MMILPPGGFLVPGLLVVAKRMLDVRAGKAIQMGGAHAAMRADESRSRLRLAHPPGLAQPRSARWHQRQGAIERSGILQQFPEIDLEQQKVGIFSKLTKLDATLADWRPDRNLPPHHGDPKMVKRKAKPPPRKSTGEAPIPAA